MITEFIKEHKKLCIIILIAIVVILIIVNVKKGDEEVVSDEAVENELYEPVDLSAELEDDVTAQTVYNGYIYGVE